MAHIFTAILCITLLVPSFAQSDPSAIISAMEKKMNPNSKTKMTLLSSSGGTACVFSAVTALSPPLDPLSPEKTNRGVTGFKVDLIPSSWISFSFLALPVPFLNETRLAIRSEVLVGETDFSLGAIRNIDSDGKNEIFFNADFAYFFDLFGVYGEGQIINKST